MLDLTSFVKTANVIQAAPLPLLLPPVTTFQIVESSLLIEEECPRRRDVAPFLEQNAEGVYVLSLYNQGKHGDFEIPYILNQIIYADESLVVILVAYHGTEVYGGGLRKNRWIAKGQFYRYYERSDDGTWLQMDWKHLPDETRTIVLAAHKEKAPGWARVPGKLSTEYATPKRRLPPTKTTAYKIMVVIEGRYYSIYDPTVEYEMGKTMKQAARPGHRGGYFSYPDQQKVIRLFEDQALFPRWCYRQPFQAALVEVEIWGRIVLYNNGKWASTYLKPLRVLQTFDYSSPN